MDLGLKLMENAVLNFLKASESLLSKKTVLTLSRCFKFILFKTFNVQLQFSIFQTFFAQTEHVKISIKIRLVDFMSSE